MFRRSVGVPGAVHAGGRRGGRRADRRAGGGAAGGQLAAGAAAGRARWPVAVCGAADAARLRGRAGGRVRGAGRGRDRPGPVGGGGGRAGRGGAAHRRGRGGRGPGAGCRGRDHGQVLAWAMEHDAGLALRLVAGLGWWWYLRGRLAGQYPLLREAAGRGVPGSDGWCAAQFFAGYAAWFAGDMAASLGYATALRDAAAKRGPCPALADGLAGRAAALVLLGWHAEAAEDARRALAVAREIALPAGAGASPGRAGYGRWSCRRSGRRGAAGPAGRADHRRSPRLDNPVVQLQLDRCADRGRGPGRRRGRLRGGPRPGPGRRRPAESGRSCCPGR